MRKRVFHIGCLAVCLAIALPSLAQEGHPLTGTWSGDWGTDLNERNHVTLVMAFEGGNIIGQMNPGPDSTPLNGVALDVTDWTVRFEANGMDDAGNPVQIMAEGQLEDLESYHRTLKGTWKQGAAEGDFTLTRD